MPDHEYHPSQFSVSSQNSIEQCYMDNLHANPCIVPLQYPAAKHINAWPQRPTCCVRLLQCMPLRFALVVMGLLSISEHTTQLRDNVTMPSICHLVLSGAQTGFEVRCAKHGMHPCEYRP